MSFLAWLVLASCARGPATNETPEAWGAARRTQGQKYLVELQAVPHPPPMGELFEMHAWLRDLEGKPIEDGRVALNARMPHHNHGMATDPIDEAGACDAENRCHHPGGRYRTSGFKFHMAGAWTVMVEVDGPKGEDRVSFVYDMPAQ